MGYQTERQSLSQEVNIEDLEKSNTLATAWALRDYLVEQGRTINFVPRWCGYSIQTITDQDEVLVNTHTTPVLGSPSKIQRERVVYTNGREIPNIRTGVSRIRGASIVIIKKQSAAQREGFHDPKGIWTDYKIHISEEVKERIKDNKIVYLQQLKETEESFLKAREITDDLHEFPDLYYQATRSLLPENEDAVFMEYPIDHVDPKHIKYTFVLSLITDVVVARSYKETRWADRVVWTDGRIQEDGDVRKVVGGSIVVIEGRRYNSSGKTVEMELEVYTTKDNFSVFESAIQQANGSKLAPESSSTIKHITPSPFDQLLQEKYT